MAFNKKNNRDDKPKRKAGSYQRKPLRKPDFKKKASNKKASNKKVTKKKLSNKSPGKS